MKLSTAVEGFQVLTTASEDKLRKNLKIMQTVSSPLLFLKYDHLATKLKTIIPDDVLKIFLRCVYERHML